VRYRQQVVAIDRNADAATVRTADGGSFSADAVVLAIPPSVWHKIAFNTHEVREIPQMGSNVKLVLKLDRPVWEQQNLTPELRSDGLVQMTWISATARQAAPLSLTLFSGGQQSEALQKMDAQRRRHNAVASLAAAYPDLGDAVTQDLFMDWPSMPHALASYSFPAPGEVMRYGPTLVDGVDDGLAPLRFAGEHTSYGFIGYMEGALSSGMRTAESLITARAPLTA
jgi:monoamine oxidase